MAKILLTGASGLLGVNLLMEAKDQHQITGVVNDNPFVLDGVEIVQADLLEPGKLTAIFDQAEPDWVIHAAALANVDACEKDSALAHFLNAEVPRELAELSKAQGVRFLHVSTDAVFDGERGEYAEGDIANPLSVYARTKLSAEQFVQEVNPDALIARVNFFGWSRTGQRSLAEFFFNNLKGGAPLKGFEDVFFCPLFANDLANILLEMLDKDLSGLYHVVSSENLSKYAFGMRIAELFGFDSSVISPISVGSAGLTAKRSPNLTLKTDKLAQALGRPLPGITEGMVRFFELYQQGYPEKIQSL